MSARINVSGNLFYVMCAVIVILAIAFLISLYKLSQHKPSQAIPQESQPPAGEPTLDKFGTLIPNVKVPVDKPLTGFLEERKINQMFFIDKDGRVIWARPNGSPVEICGRKRGIRLPTDACNLRNLDIEGQTDIQVFLIKQNPRCTWGCVGGNCGVIHAGGDGYTYGQFPCHADH